MYAPSCQDIVSDTRIPCISFDACARECAIMLYIHFAADRRNGFGKDAVVGRVRFNDKYVHQRNRMGDGEWQ